MARKKKNPNKHRVNSLSKKVNLVDYCVQHFAILGSKTAVKKAIGAEQVFLNENVALVADHVKNGDLIRLQLPKRQAVKKSKFDMDLPIVFEDDWLIIVDKPGGIAVNGNRNKTVENALIGKFKRSNEPDALPAPVAVHRLDVPTKGLVMFAKTKKALVHINKAFQAGKVDKVYYAVVHGKLPESGKINAPINGKKSITHFERLRVSPSRAFGAFSLVKLKPVTGRTHQLRIHLNDLGHLIIGDKLYAKRKKTILGKGLFLFAGELCFQHPIHKEMIEVKLPIPNRFKRLLRK